MICNLQIYNSIGYIQLQLNDKTDWKKHRTRSYSCVSIRNASDLCIIKKIKVMPTQIITSDDLREFKIELLEEIRHIFLSSQSVVNPENKRFLKSQEVMQLLNISASSLQTMRNSRILSFTRIQGTIYYDWNDIVKLMEQNKKQARTNMKFV